MVSDHHAQTSETNWQYNSSTEDNYLIYFMKRLPSIMPKKDILNGFPASQLMRKDQFF